MRLVQPKSDSYLVVVFVEQGYFVGTTKGSNCCVPFLRHSLCISSFLIIRRKPVFAFVFHRWDPGFVIFVSFLRFGRSSFIAMFLVRRNSCIVCFLSHYSVFSMFLVRCSSIIVFFLGRYFVFFILMFTYCVFAGSFERPLRTVRR